MSKKLHRYLFIIMIGLISGCQTISHNTKSSSTKNVENKEDISTAMESVAEALSGRELNKEDMRSLGKQIRKDPEAQTAIKAITDSMSGSGFKVKYCPKTGKRYAPHLEMCPEHNVELLPVEE